MERLRPSKTTRVAGYMPSKLIPDSMGGAGAPSPAAAAQRDARIGSRGLFHLAPAVRKKVGCDGAYPSMDSFLDRALSALVGLKNPIRVYQRPFAVFGQVGFLAVALTVSSCDHTPSAMPALDKTNVDAGSVIQGAPIAVNATLTNPLKVPITITGVSKSCSCTSAEFSKEILAPGDSGELSATIETHGRLGSLESVVQLSWKSEDGKTNATEALSIRADIQALAIMSPWSADLGLIDSKSETRHVIFTVRRGKADVKWNTISVRCEQATTEVVQKDNDTFEVIASFDPSTLPIGRFKDEMEITLLDQGTLVGDSLAASLAAEITGPFKVTPKSLFFGVVPLQKEFSGSFTMTTKDETFEFVSITSSNPDVLVAECTERSSNRLSFNYRGKALRAGNLSGKFNVQVRAADPVDSQDIIVPFVAFGKDEGEDVAAIEE
jgi:hypothetical protein